MIKIVQREIIKEVKKSGIDIQSLIEDTYKDPILGVYNCHEWDHGYYCWSGYNGTRREFYEDLREMVDFLYEYINFCNIKEVIVAPFHRYNIFAWEGNMKNNEGYSDLYMEVMEFLKKNNIKKGSHSGIKMETDGNRRIIEMILEGNYRHVTKLCLFFPDKYVMVEPTHHFDLIFFTKAFEEQRNIIRQIVSKYKNIRYYEKLLPSDACPK